MNNSSEKYKEALEKLHKASCLLAEILNNAEDLEKEVHEINSLIKKMEDTK